MPTASFPRSFSRSRPASLQTLLSLLNPPPPALVLPSELDVGVMAALPGAGGGVGPLMSDLDRESQPRDGPFLCPTAFGGNGAADGESGGDMVAWKPACEGPRIVGKSDGTGEGPARRPGQHSDPGDSPDLFFFDCSPEKRLGP